MRYDEMITEIGVAMDLPDEDIRKVIELFVKILQRLEEGEKVRTPLGVFRRVKQRAREVYNLQTGGDRIVLPERTIVRLKPSKSLIHIPSNQTDEDDLLETDES